MIFKSILSDCFSSDAIFYDEPMKNHTSFKVGGNADYLFLPSNVEEVITAVQLCKKYKVPFFIVGNGSNLLVRDHGYRGMIIKIGEGMKKCTQKEETIVEAEAGILLSELSSFVYQQQLTGFEFASGIPGTLGGAVYMNAGAYGGEIKDVLKEAVVFDPKDNQVRTLSNEEMEFGYRTSCAQKEETIVLKATFQFAEGNKEDILHTMMDLNKRRREKQPLEYPSAGSTFKRPEGHFAGKLIMDCGLRGARVGGAQVSEKHCGFIINTGQASADDILALIQHVQDCVYRQYKVVLEPEVRMIGE